MSDKMRIFAAEACELPGSRAVRLLLGFAVREMYGIGLPEIRKTEPGKPFFPERPDIFFSLSHTKEYVACAVAGYPVGLDVETEREILPSLSGRICSPGEMAEFSFFQSWVLKESYIKLCGTLTDSYVNIAFSRSGSGILAPSPEVSAALFPKLGGTFAGACCIGKMADRIELVDAAKVYGGY